MGDGRIGVGKTVARLDPGGADAVSTFRRPRFAWMGRACALRASGCPSRAAAGRRKRSSGFGWTCRAVNPRKRGCRRAQDRGRAKKIAGEGCRKPAPGPCLSGAKPVVARVSGRWQAPGQGPRMFQARYAIRGLKLGFTRPASVGGAPAPMLFFQGPCSSEVADWKVSELKPFPQKLNPRAPSPQPRAAPRARPPAWPPRAARHWPGWSRAAAAGASPAAPAA